MQCRLKPIWLWHVANGFISPRMGGGILRIRKLSFADFHATAFVLGMSPIALGFQPYWLNIYIQGWKLVRTGLGIISNRSDFPKVRTKAE